MFLSQRQIFQYLTAIFLLLFQNIALADSLEKLIMPGKVIQGHAKYENDCNKCHEILNKDSQNSLCLDCHKDVNKDIESSKGFHGLFKSAGGKPCKSCHIEHKGRDADIVKLDKRIFQHQFTDFPLKGAHKRIECSQCHKPDKKHRETSSLCYQCHEDNPHKERLGKKCSQCHNQSQWTAIDFDHDKTKFSLKGKHTKLACNSCHLNNKYKDTPKDCFSCHSVDDVHGGKNGNKCSKCHNVAGWKKLQFDHDKDTKFKLLGRHKSVDCRSCHPKDPYRVKVKQTCISCHQADDRHNARYGDKCQTCHGFDKWKKLHFNHDKSTKFKLTGKHKQASCSACHKGFIYKQKTPVKCVSCHQLDDVHKGKSDQKCELCHDAKDWASKVMFDHDLSRFPLNGLHAITACDDCHLSKMYKATSIQCNKCHQDEDEHKGRFGPACENCHTPNGWNLWVFDHARDTDFTLDGAHKELHCYQCHQQGAEHGIALGQSCGFCHASDDPHNNQFGQFCEQCHSTKSFKKINMLDN
ncbi:MAG: cytochrome C [Gammaproteobacteria bacterium]|nr:cytochrome C [Gammaproteobacteria bacterium]